MTPAPSSAHRAPAWLHLGDEVGAALASGEPVVALESTVIAHGLPWPENLEVARALEATVRDAGAVPATVGIVAGRPTAGLSDAQIERFAQGGITKAGARDVPALMASGAYGATTVAGSLALAAAAGIAILATGGIGGVHRGYADSADESADLLALARFPVAVVASGAKCVLDLGATLERLETYGVAVVGFGTDRFPAFYYRDSGLPLDARVDTVREAAATLAAMQATRCGGLLLANPIPAADALDAGQIEALVETACREAQRRGITGKAITPFLLSRLAESTAGASLAANRALLSNNARLAAAIAVEGVALPSTG